MRMRALDQRAVTTWVALFLAAVILCGCASDFPLPHESSLWVYTVDGAGKDMDERWAPAFVAYDHKQVYNRIGRPTIHLDVAGDQEAVIDTEYPVVYFMRRPFTTKRGSYTNLIYRVHFPEVPFSLVPFNLTAGKNVGLLVVITLDAKDQPVLVTTVHTCGCYLAIIPTSYLPKKAFPKDWSGRVLDIYGEHLPPLLRFGPVAAASLRILVYLRPGVHRVMNIELRNSRDLLGRPFRNIPMQIEAMDHLNRLAAGNGTASFFYTCGVLEGHVRDSIKPWESLFLSLISMDPFVGSDKAYADPHITGNPFYTSLKPWRRNDSDMWDFPRFLQYWGWRL